MHEILALPRIARSLPDTKSLARGTTDCLKGMLRRQRSRHMNNSTSQRLRFHLCAGVLLLTSAGLVGCTKTQADTTPPGPEQPAACLEGECADQDDTKKAELDAEQPTEAAETPTEEAASEAPQSAQAPPEEADASHRS